MAAAHGLSSTATTSLRAFQGGAPSSFLPYDNRHHCGIGRTTAMVASTGRICMSKKMRSLRSSSSYVRRQDDTRLFLSKYAMSAHIVQKRTGTIKCATSEEIEAAKSLVEKEAKERMEKAIESVRRNFNSVRTGRANPAMLDRIEVEYHGIPVRLKTIAQITTPDPRSLLVQPYDKSILKAIEKAIVKSYLDVTPSNDGEVICVSIPPLTSEGRKELSRVVSKQAEEGKVAIRMARRAAIKAYAKLEKEKKFSKDNVRDLSSDVQELTDEYIKKLESIHKQKEKELLTV